jgi:hypothetical protein
MTGDHRFDDETEHGQIEMMRARGAQRVGFVWILLISTVLAAVVLFGYWAIESGHLASARQAAEGPTAPAAAFTKTPAPALGVGPVR